jgi:glycosyltransferase involved in cell wall biosynthesis
MTRVLYPVIYGVEYFIEAIPLVLDKEPDTRVLMVGYGSLDQELRARVAELGLDDVVHFAGRVEHSDMPDYVNAADIYVSMSLSDATSVSLLEAMACALPVVLSDTPDNREWVVPGENGLLVNVGNYPMIHKAINQLLRKHPDLWNETFATSRDNPLPVSDTYSEDIASALIALLRDPEARQKMAQRNLKIARERADLDIQFGEFERIAEQLLENRR